LVELARQCGIDAECDGAGLAEGNASISGVASFDAYFQTALGFRSRADSLASSLEAELDAIGGAFGVPNDAELAAGLRTSIDANVESGLTIVADRPRCQVDARATAEASARCSTEASPTSAMIGCAGSCELSSDGVATCAADADLKCTFTSADAICDGACAGTCTIDVAGGTCEGICRGTCTGTCSLFSDAQATQCAGECDGTCDGSCETVLVTPATCEGRCGGECTVDDPQNGCDGAIRRLCEARDNATITCAGRCLGDVEPPPAEVQCEHSALLQARMNVECAPPRIAIDYRLKAGLDPQIAARFRAGVSVLAARLPTLLSTVARAEAMSQAGAQLTSNRDIEAALEDALDRAGESNLRLLFGLNCALRELDDVPRVIAPAADHLSDAVRDALDLQRSLGLP
jgi:hypothetical protein